MEERSELPVGGGEPPGDSLTRADGGCRSTTLVPMREKEMVSPPVGSSESAGREPKRQSERQERKRNKGSDTQTHYRLAAK